MTFRIHFFSFQEIISEEIVDETDRYEDNHHKKRAKRVTTSAIMRGSVFFFQKKKNQTMVHIPTNFFFSRIVERERRRDTKDTISECTPLLWHEPRSPSSDCPTPPAIAVGDTPLKYGAIRNVLLNESPPDRDDDGN